MDEEIKTHLEAYYEIKFPDKLDLEISNLTSITTGWENEMYAFDMEYSLDGIQRREELVLRIYPGIDAYSKSEHEFNGMSKLHQTGYPVPQVQLLERENSPFGQPFVIMERIRGQDMWSILSAETAPNQQVLITKFCELFLTLHRLDWRTFAADQSPDEVKGDPYIFIDQWLDNARALLTRFSKTEFNPIIEWLEHRRERVPCERPSVVHFDFHPMNILLRPDGSAVVIDWPGLRVTDARFDLGWTLLLTQIYSGKSLRDRILEEYQRLAGGTIDEIEIFEVAACARRLFDVTVSMEQGAEQLGMRPGAAQVMAQQMDVIGRVYDLLVELTGIRIPEVEQLLHT